MQLLRYKKEDVVGQVTRLNLLPSLIYEKVASGQAKLKVVIMSQKG